MPHWRRRKESSLHFFIFYNWTKPSSLFFSHLLRLLLSSLIPLGIFLLSPSHMQAARILAPFFFFLPLFSSFPWSLLSENIFLSSASQCLSNTASRRLGRQAGGQADRQVRAGGRDSNRSLLGPSLMSRMFFGNDLQKLMLFSNFFFSLSPMLYVWAHVFRPKNTYLQASWFERKIIVVGFSAPDVNGACLAPFQPTRRGRHQ